MPNSLTRRVSLKIGPLFFETLVKHYFDRALKNGTKLGVPLRSDELLYDEAFNIVKYPAARHTVEELQSFSNVRTPSPPWVHVVRLVIPMSSCDDAAALLIKAFGGEEVMKRLVGGTKWWQVRGIRGLDAEWVSAKKDWQEARRREKEKDRPSRGSSVAERRNHPVEGLGIRAPGFEHILSPPSSDSGDEGRDRPSEASERESSKDSGAYQPEMDEMRCILYSHGGGYYFGSVDQESCELPPRPQYPFPCAIQDLVAAYLFLIRPPEGAAHRPVRPEHIVIAGDSAGGGLSLALLQIIRDSGLPAPAGGVLISPWCDFTHSFPSIFTNTDTDVIPVTVFPCKTELSLASAPHASRPAATTRETKSENITPKFLPTQQGPMNVGSTVSLPAPGVLEPNQSVWLETPEGEKVEVTQQIQLYAPNGLLRHPLVSPALSYLGGLPPLFFIAGDREVLRDEIIYAAHRAAHPDQYPVSEETKKMYPAFESIETHLRPTPVHLQVYDDVAHVLPVLFPFTTPGKYCYRAMALFCKHVTSMSQAPLSPVLLTPSGHTPAPDFAFSASPTTLTPREGDGVPPLLGHPAKSRKSLSSGISQVTPGSQDGPSEASVDVAGPRFGDGSEPHRQETMAGEAGVYQGNWAKIATRRSMIRERVSTQGIIRPLEDESELPALQVPPALVGTLSERAIRRFIKGKEHFDHIAALQHYLDREDAHGGAGPGASWNMAWALDADERPPPSSIVARRDTAEALKLARVADEAVLASERALSANNLWGVVVSFLTATPDRHEDAPAPGSGSGGAKGKPHVVGARRRRFRSFLRERRPSEGTAAPAPAPPTQSGCESAVEAV
ncbi:hypothetical protein BC834DRAFT_902176 [Gloeopeniophorella convolvens]|nr:hypothetical protein BC834DRAFT_902176 [Gloeopeniophorella convolvens]